MLESQTEHVVDLVDLRGKTHVFANRRHAGQVLAGMLEDLRGEDAIVFAIPAGGVPVAVEVGQRLHWPIDVAVVSKITLPWNSEVGYGAVAFDGSVQLNREFMVELGLEPEVASEGVTSTHEKVCRRVTAFRGQKAPPRVTGRHVILVDDGLASGYTMRVAVAALRKM
ncbi:MAG: phosphoribosyltransferase, partial [Planctomycetota bacterium]